MVILIYNRLDKTEREVEEKVRNERERERE